MVVNSIKNNNLEGVRIHRGPHQAALLYLYDTLISMKQQQIKDSYNQESKLWDDLMVLGDDLLQINKPFFDLLKEHSVKTILDLGCGSGMHSIQFAKMGYAVTGVDLSPGMIERARSSADNMKNVQFVCSAMDEYSPEEPFDAIWACSSLHNMDKGALIKSLHHVIELLKDNNGVLAITMRHGDFEGEIERNNIKRYYRYSSPEEIQKLLANYPLERRAITKKVWNEVPYFTLYYTKKSA